MIRRATARLARGLYSAHVVAQITEGTAFDKHGRPFRRRNYLPAIIVLVVLVVVTAVVWIIALTRPAEVHEATACNPPPAADRSDTSPSWASRCRAADMTDVTPAKLADTKIRVLNASGQGGQAADVAGALRDLGFAQPTAANDPIYASTRLNCQGQIRFGPAGQAGRGRGVAGGAVHRAVPRRPRRRLRRPGHRHRLQRADPQRRHRRGAGQPAPGATEPADSALLTKIHAGSC